MRLHVLSRSDAEWSGIHDATPNVSRASRNHNPTLHAPSRPLDVQRAITASKISRNLARPFLFACAPSHVDGVYCLAKSRKDVSLCASASADGELRLWHLPSHSPQFDITPSPPAFVRGLTFNHDSSRILMATDAKIVHSVSVDTNYSTDATLLNNIPNYQSNTGPLASISAHYNKPHFATASSVVQIWDENRSSPLQTLSLTVDSLHCVRYNPIEPHILASAGSDRSIILYDTRANSAIRRLVLSMRTNDIAWNPMEAFNFTVANDDHNCYTYDMRRLSTFGAVKVHKDHVAAVMSLDYSPTGQEFVTGSYDKTIRIFPRSTGRSREVYHTKRMQRVFAVNFSLDGSYIISGSDDGDVRVWKSERSRPLKPLFRMEKEKVQASERLIERYQGLTAVRKIAKKRHLPSHVKTMRDTKQVMSRSRKRKERNFQQHTRPKDRTRLPSEKKRNIVRELA